MTTRKQKLEEEQRALREYENPPIADDEEKRIENAVEYRLKRKWPENLSLEKAGLENRRLLTR